MSKLSKKEYRLGKNFRQAKELEGFMTGQEVRAERRIWKKAMSKIRRQQDKKALKELSN